jgi:hypothetical protein
VIDPFNIPRPAMFPLAAPCRLTSQDDGKRTPVHMHRAYPDAEGNGMTDHVAGHTHYLRGWEVVPSSIDGHKHTLSNIRCGAGRP